MREAGINTVRVFTVPPVWLLDAAAEARAEGAGRAALVAARRLSRQPAIQAQIREAVAAGVRACAPPSGGLRLSRSATRSRPTWSAGTAPSAVRRFLKSLVALVKAEHPGALVSYANFPSTEYLTVDFTDFVCFNVYLHDEPAFRRYIARLHNLAVDKPLVLTEFGVDSMHNGEEEQRRVLSWQVRAAFGAGVAGTFVFAWTDEWFTGGHLIEDWAFGLVDRERQPKPAFRRGRAPLYAARCRRRCRAIRGSRSSSAPTMPSARWRPASPRSRCSTIRITRSSSSMTARPTAPSKSPSSFPYCRIISQPNKGLSVARNVGAEAATGEIVAYTDSDCVADPDWLTYLVAKMEASRLAACGGPNFPPPEDSLVPAAVAVSPGGPTHVLISDEVAEHIAGCNMAFRRDVLLALGGFDPVYRAAGDDVDICWRFQDAGYTIGFSAGGDGLAFPPQHGEGLYRPADGLRQGRGARLCQAPVPLQPVRPGEMARPHLWRSVGLAAAVAPAGHLFRRVRARPVPDDVRAAVVVDRVLAADLRVERRRAGCSRLPASLSAAGCGCSRCRLLATWAMCVNGALKAPIDQRFTGVKARALVALLIYLGPLLRGWERLKWRIKTMQAQDHVGLARDRAARPHRLARRAPSMLSYWSEAGAEKEALLGGLMDFLVPQKYFVVPDTGWSNWDLKICARPVRAGRWSSSAPRTTAAPSGCCGCAARCGCRASPVSCCAAVPRSPRSR